MRFGTQFTGTVTAGQTRTWFTHSWNAASNVVWSVVPTAPVVDGAAQVEWKVRSTRQATNLVKWFIEVKNVTNVPVTFQARYAVLDG
ncbi:hypothetical protein [Gordonia sp. (in: high G+C Gram-positive bacteria)]|jgi:hypothetical protein|uniref:hypothetical protein n=1 Tax=Gordonia sp. (in: high G+C Gram-positive bacteria) TaxID=84139 RepID=UPI001DB07AA7|nr:hypothetical protein [Gordonia sp. (in: high G+C Gram-positive bacteria)]MCB1295060.1 hypothetical protein [Gordonia sp. (in: high G+C Gram-positive bacteria)]HMS74214.1 hypothetical protein [Gordonia sp. (in: high G+C Gram-positive bacteria)]HPQ42202.1 hypothetical protein [bacterium]HQV18037.1 hypothetical protein [Gordonia sp. (in: high G+C Gram-positive bacteria)]